MDGRTERVDRMLEDTLRSICAEAPRSWPDQLPMVELHSTMQYTHINGVYPILRERGHGTEYTMDLPKSMATYPTFYVGCVKRYHDPLRSTPWMEEGGEPTSSKLG
ncbi:Reverse transcriptase [Phytophthora palmivora]|uniref:Reverse transcriptase n=1 Tax=Phytophthora palmivora TaxID=4796 RepID=A0A2P4YE44_9STRA|nr:Reverse transcriptase [Phytophthora palmivora]